MGRYPGLVTTDVSGLLLPELRPVLALDLTAAEAADLDADGILVDAESSTTAVVVATTMAAQPPQARGLTFLPSAAADVGNIVVAGTDIDDNPITDSVATNGASAVASAKAFKTVTSVTFPIDDAAVTWKVGWDERIGLPFKLASKPFYFEMFNNAIEIATAGSLVTNATDLAKNTYDPQGDLDGLKPLKLILFL